MARQTANNKNPGGRLNYALPVTSLERFLIGNLLEKSGVFT